MTYNQKIRSQLSLKQADGIPVQNVVHQNGKC